MSQTYSTYYKYKDGATGGSSGGGGIPNSPSATGEDLKEYFGEDGVLSTLGGVQKSTGLILSPVITTNEYGVVKRGDHLPGNVWFKVRGKISDTGNILALFPTNPDGPLPLVAQNGVSAWWTANTQTLPNAPAGITGNSEIEVKTLGKWCEVMITNNGGKIYNYTTDITAETITWQPNWSYSTHLTTPGVQNKLIASDGPAKIRNIDIWAHEDGKFSMGSANKLPGAKLSVDGTVAGEAPVNGKDFVNLQDLAERLSAAATDEELQAIRTELLNEIATRAERNHTHQMADIIGLFLEFDKYLNKGVFGGGQPYFLLARDADGNATIIDGSGARLLINELPPAQRGVAYNYTIQASQFIWPFGSVNHEVTLVSAARVRGDLGWLTITEHNTGTGNTLGGTAPTTPDTESETSVTVIMEWQAHYAAKVQQARFTLPLAIYPTTASIIIPNQIVTFAAYPVSDTEILLAWVDNSTNEAGFEIDYSLDTSEWTRLATKQAGAQSHSHLNLTASTHYYYRIRAINSAGESAYAYADATTDTVTVPTPFEEVWVDGSARLKVDSPTPIVTLPNAPSLVFVQRTATNQITVRATNRHTSTANMEFQAKEVGTTDWYTMKNDGGFALTTTTPMQIGFNAGSEWNMFFTSSFFSGKVVEFRVRVTVGNLSSIWTDPKSE